jgi:GNAT superfamily N-acetyltransferase
MDSEMTDRDLTIRPMRAEDEPVWRQLWAAYLAYYETTLPEEVYGTTFARLRSGAPREFSGLLAVRNGVPVGLVHYLFHPSSWSQGDVCYLQDLFTLPQARGTGVARALIGAVYAAADAAGAAPVYWFTQDFNATARRLYDRIGGLTPFMRYNRRFADATPLPAGAAIRPVVAADEADWRRLWADYLTFYQTDLPEEVTAGTFARVIADDPATMRARLLTVDGHPAGLVQFVTHRSCWKVENVCYLQDLYADPGLRGRGLGRALIEAVYAEADRIGAPAVYWLTATSNSTARLLYDRVGQPTPFVQYERMP